MSEIGMVPSYPAQQEPVQRQVPEEEELLQGKMMDTVQRQVPEEEELLQGKMMDTVQRQVPEEEELLQGKMMETVPRLLNSMSLQAKLTVSNPNDIYEQEADRVAEDVTRSIDTPVLRQTPEDDEELMQGKLVQRQAPEEEELMQGKFNVQRQTPEEEEELQMQSNQSMAATVADDVETRINSARGGGHPLSDEVKNPMEQAFGADFSGVRTHTDSEADTLNQAISARAFTTGQDVFFRDGEYSPGSESGRKLIAHELTHVVQQASGKTVARKVDDLPVPSNSEVFDYVIKHLPVLVIHYNKMGGDKAPDLSKQLMVLGSIISNVALWYEKHRDEVREISVDMMPVYNQIKLVYKAAIKERIKVNAQLSELLALETIAADKHGARVIFGLDGKTEAQILSALEVGYRRFDCAESYNNTQLLANALDKQKISRDQVEITYKFDVKPEEKASDLEARLQKVVDMFTRLDALLIHSIAESPSNDIRTGWSVLNTLKKDKKTVKKIGLGNIGESHAELIKELQGTGTIDVIENSLESVLGSEALQKLIKSTKGQLFYYNVISAARAIGVNNEEGIKALLWNISSLMEKKSQPILSSGSRERQIENLLKYGPEEVTTEDYEQLGKIDTWQKAQRFCTANGPELVLPAGTRTELSDILNNNETVRESIAASAKAEKQEHNAVYIIKWLNTNRNRIDKESYDTVTVPSREGVNKKYLNMTLREVLVNLLGTKSCDYKWAIELLQLLLSNVKNWNTLGKAACTEITK
jgi:diketogulonate reductase-like aldo/keto reductase